MSPTSKLTSAPRTSGPQSQRLWNRLPPTSGPSLTSGSVLAHQQSGTSSKTPRLHPRDMINIISTTVCYWVGQKKKSFWFFHNSLWKNPNFLANSIYMKVVKRINSKNCHHKEKRSISVLDGGWAFSVSFLLSLPSRLSLPPNNRTRRTNFKLKYHVGKGFHISFHDHYILDLESDLAL